jgi:hypothetical protein
MPRPTPVHDREYEERALQRRSTWSFSTDLTNSTVAMDEPAVWARLALMAELSETGWSLLGRTFPVYERSTMPCVIWRSNGTR